VYSDRQLTHTAGRVRQLAIATHTAGRVYSTVLVLCEYSKLKLFATF